MNNLLPSGIQYHEKYDLKGSTYKRKSNPRELKKKSPTYKDLDFMERHEEVSVVGGGGGGGIGGELELGRRIGEGELGGIIEGSFGKDWSWVGRNRGALGGRMLEESWEGLGMGVEEGMAGRLGGKDECSVLPKPLDISEFPRSLDGMFPGRVTLYWSSVCHIYELLYTSQLYPVWAPVTWNMYLRLSQDGLCLVPIHRKPLALEHSLSML